MVYKLGSTYDMSILPKVNEYIYCKLNTLCSVFDIFYDKHRDIDNDDGGFVVYADRGTSAEDIKNCFDYSKHIPECISYEDNSDLCTVSYILNNEFTVILVLSKEDVPVEILKELEN